MHEREDSQAKSGCAFLLGERLKGCVSCMHYKASSGELPPGPPCSLPSYVLVSLYHKVLLTRFKLRLRIYQLTALDTSPVGTFGKSLADYKTFSFSYCSPAFILVGGPPQQSLPT